jgi:hypothetical protein
MEGLMSIPGRRTLLIIAVVSGVLTVAIGLKLRAIDQELTPYSIVHYEFAGSAERAQKMFTKWDETGREAARESLRYDAPYLLVYPFFVSALVLLSARAGTRKLTPWETRFTVAPFIAALLDVLEDVALWRALDRFEQPPEGFLQFAALMAGVKFLLLIASALYVLGVGLPALVARLRARR